MQAYQLLAAILSLANSALSQDGYSATQIFYSGSKNCNPVSRSGGVTYVAPGQCQTFNPSGLGLTSLDSVNVTTVVEPNCAVFYYTNNNCNAGKKDAMRTLGGINKCVSNPNGPFLSTKVICP